MASADTTIKVSSRFDVGEPKPGNPESAGFSQHLNLYILYYTPILGFSEDIHYLKWYRIPGLTVTHNP